MARGIDQLDKIYSGDPDQINFVLSAEVVRQNRILTDELSKGRRWLLLLVIVLDCRLRKTPPNMTGDWAGYSSQASPACPSQAPPAFHHPAQCFRISKLQ